MESEIKVYTKNGELTLVYLKEDIIKRYKNNLTDLESIDFEGKIAAKYLAVDTVELTLDNKREEKPRQVKEYNGLIYWEKPDTSILSVGMTINFLSILKYQPLYFKEFYVPTPSGYTNATKYKECFLVKKKGDVFEVPMFDCVYETEFGQQIITGINDEFNENSLSLIGDDDIILIQEYKIEMKQKISQ